ncbi:MAG: DUF2852 domain-containing protein [Hyphomicrobiaceae bacterium]|nr:DUF2852 domain-containing protein [Hyphomicrobiaceae bacterium]MCC0023302.1 DUF2852 domain-containing protein [Hyphomicrobiaceae bacterium]
MEIAAKLDEWGKGAWIVVMILGFMLFWPFGLAILAYMIWSGRMMGCRHHGWNDEMRDEWRQRRREMKEEWRARKEEWREHLRSRHAAMHEEAHRHHQAMRPSGNAAFDEYKAETLRRLEDEQAEFSEFLDNLRKSRDKAEFDQFMQGRRRDIEPEQHNTESDNGSSPN